MRHRRAWPAGGLVRRLPRGYQRSRRTDLGGGGGNGVCLPGGPPLPEVDAGLPARGGWWQWSPAGDLWAPRREGRAMAGPAAKGRVVYPLEKRVVNPVVMLAWRLGIPPPGDALLETTGRRTGQPRRTPVCDGLDGQTFWLVAQRGRSADWVKNIQANPRVRVKVRTGSGVGWRTGTAHILDDDDPRERQRRIGQRNLARRLCVSASAAMDTDPLTVRVDLDPR